MEPIVDFERVQGLGLDQGLKLRGVVALQELDRRRQHEDVGEQHAGEEQHRRDDHGRQRDRLLARSQRRHDEGE